MQKTWRKLSERTPPFCKLNERVGDSKQYLQLGQAIMRPELALNSIIRSVLRRLEIGSMLGFGLSQVPILVHVHAPLRPSRILEALYILFWNGLGTFCERKSLHQNVKGSNAGFSELGLRERFARQKCELVLSGTINADPTKYTLNSRFEPMDVQGEISSRNKMSFLPSLGSFEATYSYEQ